MTINEAIEILQREYNCRIDKGNVCASSIYCNRCEHYVDADIVTETLKTVLDAFGNCSELPNSSDLVSQNHTKDETDITVVYCQNDNCIYLDGNICICDSMFIDGVGGCVTEEIKVEDDEFKEDE